MISDNKVKKVIEFIYKVYEIHAICEFVKITTEEFVNFFEVIVLIEDLVTRSYGEAFDQDSVNDLIDEYRREHGQTTKEIGVGKVPATLVTFNSLMNSIIIMLDIYKSNNTTEIDIAIETYRKIVDPYRNINYLIVLDDGKLSKFSESDQICIICHEVLHIVEDKIGIDDMTSESRNLADEYLKKESN